MTRACEIRIDVPLTWRMFFATYAVHLFELLSDIIEKTGDKVLTKWQQ